MCRAVTYKQSFIIISYTPIKSHCFFFKELLSYFRKQKLFSYYINLIIVSDKTLLHETISFNKILKHPCKIFMKFKALFYGFIIIVVVVVVVDETTILKDNDSNFLIQ